MKISTEIGSAAKRIGEERVVEYVAKAGFDHWDFSMFDMCRYDSVTKLAIETGHPLTGSQRLAFARRLKQIGLDNGITCNQSHAPFSCNYPCVRSRLKWAIECTAEAGGKICVIHPQTNQSAEVNAEMYWELLPFAKECGVKIATENMWDWDVVKDESSFAACATGEDFLKHLERLEKYDNTYLDISGTGLFRYGMLREGIRRVGAEKFLFGTDYPITNPGMYVQAVLYEHITDADREMIFCKNAERILGV